MRLSELDQLIENLRTSEQVSDIGERIAEIQLLFKNGEITMSERAEMLEDVAELAESRTLAADLEQRLLLEKAVEVAKFIIKLTG